MGVSGLFHGWWARLHLGRMWSSSVTRKADHHIVVLGFWIKARLEERFLREQLGREAYDTYARRTGMLFPNLRTIARG
jgi:protein-S-isoprenylcysteine O-methyltransferase Ste14